MLKICLKNKKRQFVEWKDIDASSFPKYMATLQGHIS